jgi:ASC-1-like (ASCH) protein
MNTTHFPPKEVSEPNFSQIVAGLKIYEGRLRSEWWSNVGVGDSILLHRKGSSPDTALLFKVTEVVFARDFAELYDKLGRALLPDIDNAADAAEYYGNFFSPATVANLGVMGLKLSRD